ncbi:anthranilate synthase component I [Eggerthellaceae bacterium zg-887]|uniref:anthranilate synthase component I family protein n=1 Tax=Xiamenia xianingshaonis TaxID=2682776 RepID=UPI0014078A6F|nr:anthranilate synthase component I family protein [Xiamenia xianingshaonis]NHM15168.1 anthranilate synthase component I [Xiamenia xianingshaonis]
MTEPRLAHVEALLARGTCRRVPVKRELYADFITPVEALRRLRAASHHCFLLESAEANEQRGRYTFLGCNPNLEITCSDGRIRVRRNVEGADPVVETFSVDHPASAIRAILAEHQSADLPDFPPFTGGLVGYFSYDYVKYAEPRLRTAAPEGDFLDADLMLFDSVVVFDSFKQKIILVTGVYGNADDPLDSDAVRASYEAASARLDVFEHLLKNGPAHDFPPLHLASPLTPRCSKSEYAAMIEAAKTRIREGDIFQVVLSNPLSAPAEGSLFDAYRVLRCENPSPYLFYFTSDDVEIAGASPETLVRLQHGRLETYPLAGTRPRGATPAQDAAAEADLLADEKELAEHNMLVDLGRNDLGRVSVLGSVQVERYLDVLRFSRVMHLGSTVASDIDPDKDALDAIDAVLPAGTLSGAPKLRACQIIQELEGAPRGIYGGAVGYLDFSGNMDLCIAIRLAYQKAGVVRVQSGAGIVADSVAENEWHECANKARAVVDALQTAEGGLA